LAAEVGVLQTRNPDHKISLVTHRLTFAFEENRGHWFDLADNQVTLEGTLRQPQVQGPGNG